MATRSIQGSGREGIIEVPSASREDLNHFVSEDGEGIYGFGLCECGCGERTTLAKQTDTMRGYVKGRPVQFIQGHQNKRWLRRDYRQAYYNAWPHELVPFGYCWCGCGEKTPIANASRPAENMVLGMPLRYAGRGHWSRGAPSGEDPRFVVDARRGIAFVPLAGSEKRATVDAKDAEWVARWRWRLDSQGYAVCNRIEGSPFMHRLISGAHGKEQTDHVNRNKLDNRRANLRIATAGQNKANQGKRKGSGSGAKSKYKGVCWDNTWKRWRAQITISGKFRSLGYFDDEAEAARAYDAAAYDAWGEFALRNLPQDERAGHV